MSEVALQTFPELVAKTLIQQTVTIEDGWRDAMRQRAVGTSYCMAPLHALSQNAPDLIRALAEAVRTGAVEPPEDLVARVRRLSALAGEHLRGLESLQALYDQVWEVIQGILVTAAPEPEEVHRVHQRIGAFHLAFLEGISSAPRHTSVRAALHDAAVLHRFGRTLNHELRNHVYALQMQVRLLREPTFATDEARRDQVLNRMKTALTELSQAADRVLVSTRSPMAQAQAPAASLREVVGELSKDLAAFATSLGVRLQIEDLPDEPVQVEPVQIALTELVVNAVKFHDLKRQAPQVWIRGAEARGEVHFEVVDNGPGIPRAIQENLFTLGLRGPKVTVPGQGRGLWEACQVITEIGGRVEVDARPGGGSIFRVVVGGSPTIGG